MISPSSELRVIKKHQPRTVGEAIRVINKANTTHRSATTLKMDHVIFVLEANKCNKILGELDEAH